MAGGMELRGGLLGREPTVLAVRAGVWGAWRGHVFMFQQQEACPGSQQAPVFCRGQRKGLASGAGLLRSRQPLPATDGLPTTALRSTSPEGRQPKEDKAKVTNNSQREIF